MEIKKVLQQVLKLQRIAQSNLAAVSHKSTIASFKQERPELFDTANINSIIRIIEHGRTFRSGWDYASLLNWALAFEDHITTHFNRTVFQKQFYLYYAVAIFYEQKDYDQAFALCEKASAIVVEDEDYEVDVEIYKEIGIFHRHLDHYEKADEVLTRAVHMLEKHDLRYSRSHIPIVLNLAILYLEMEKYTEAIQLTDEALQLILINNYIENIDSLCLLKARLLSYQQNISECEAYLQFSRLFSELLGASALIPHIEAIEAIVELNKVDIWFHKNKPLIYYDKHEILDIHRHYMSQPEVKDRFLEQEITRLQRQIIKLQNQKSTLLHIKKSS